MLASRSSFFFWRGGGAIVVGDELFTIPPLIKVRQKFYSHFIGFLPVEIFYGRSVMYLINYSTCTCRPTVCTLYISAFTVMFTKAAVYCYQVFNFLSIKIISCFFRKLTLNRWLWTKHLTYMYLYSVLSYFALWDVYWVVSLLRTDVYYNIET